jgi:uncharacterized membrane protein SirB2
MYETLKLVHISAATLSICGFVLRGTWMLQDSAWLGRTGVRVVPHVVDTVFLASGIGLVWLLHLPVLRIPWLMTKLVAIVVYIGLGMLALRRGRSKTARASAFGAALLVYAYIVGVAISKSTSSWLAFLAG